MLYNHHQLIFPKWRIVMKFLRSGQKQLAPCRIASFISWRMYMHLLLALLCLPKFILALGYQILQVAGSHTATIGCFLTSFSFHSIWEEQHRETMKTVSYSKSEARFILNSSMRAQLDPHPNFVGVDSFFKDNKFESQHTTKLSWSSNWKKSHS